MHSDFHVRESFSWLPVGRWFCSDSSTSLDDWNTVAAIIKPNTTPTNVLTDGVVSYTDAKAVGSNSAMVFKIQPRLKHGRLSKTNLNMLSLYFES